MKKLGLFLFAVALFCFGIATPGCSKSVSGEAPEVSAGTWINTDSFKLADHKDKIVVVEFWATWCPPCRTTIPHLKTMYEEYKNKGVMIVSLSQEPADTINEFNKKAGMNWIIGAESSSGSAYGVTGIPAAYIVVDGKIVWNGHPMDGLDAKIKELVEARGGSAAAPVPAKEPVAEPSPDAAGKTLFPETEEPAADEIILPDDEEELVPQEGEEPASADASNEDPILPADDKILEDSEVNLGE